MDGPLGERGFTVPSWPKEYGGAGLNKDEVVVLQQEMQRINARPALVGMGLSMIGPALLEYGTDAQKKNTCQKLPEVTFGGAGLQRTRLRFRPSELAHFGRRRRRRLYYQRAKIWTSGADNADWMFCLVEPTLTPPSMTGSPLCYST
ncbi:MAG: hypothetical protein CM15mP120_02550 [Pseudomonadota bacterium]|nr:MAG: hypothetical protein CM15mP120_02550 [Pseudomonadota bacterium]